MFTSPKEMDIVLKAIAESGYQVNSKESPKDHVPVIYNGNELYNLDLHCFGGLVVTPYWKTHEDPEFENILVYLESKEDIPKFKELFENKNVVFSVEGEMPPKYFHEIIALLNEDLP